MNSRVLITGAAGFTGKYLAEHLSEIGYEVWGLDKPRQIVQPSSALNMHMHYVDICSAGKVHQVLDECRPGSIYHLAAQSSVGVSWQEPAATMKINLEGSINLLEAIRKLKLDTRILLVGSGEEYGPVNAAELPVGEEKVPNPQNPYSMSKLFQTMMGMQYFHSYGMQIYLCRAFNHTGPGQTPGFVVPDFASQVARIEANLQEPVIRVGNLGARRDFSDVRDVVRAYSNIIEKGSPGKIYNVGSGRAISIQAILDMLLRLSPSNIKVEIDPGKFRPVDTPIIYCSTDRIREDTGWQPRIEIEDTIKATLEFWRDKVKKEIKNK
jgi:GDP-D-mannose dehydratase